MKRIYTLTLAFLTCMSFVRADNYSGFCGDNLTWMLDLETKTLIIEGYGKMTSTPWVSYPYNTYIANVQLPEGLENIPVNSFSDCQALTSISIPNSVTSIGEMAFFGCTSLVSATIGNGITSFEEYGAFSGCISLTSVTIGSSVTNIESSTFQGCPVNEIHYTGTIQEWCEKPWSPTDISSSYDLYLQDVKATDVIIPDNITSIGQFVFRECTSLTSVIIGNNVTSIGFYAFHNCTNLTIVTISNSVTSIEDYAFNSCFGLTSVTIGSNVTNIGLGAFSDCNSLASISVDDGNHNFSSQEGVLFNKEKTTLIQYPASKQGEYTIPNSVTNIRGNAFEGCSGLTSVTIPSSVTSIESYAFSGCISLTSIDIPNSVTSVGYRAFWDCTGLTSPVYNDHVFAYMPLSFSGIYALPDGIKSIAGAAFSYCNNLTSVNIPNSVTSIGSQAFGHCGGLTSVAIPNSVTSIGSYAFYCSGLTTITIPNSITSIEVGVFDGCTSLTHVIIPNSVQSIKSCAFQGCSNLTSIELPNSVTSIEGYAFNNCYGVTSVTIASSVISIGEMAFQHCNNLKSMTCYATTPPKLGSDVFYNVHCPSIPLYVPIGSVDAYKAADQWKDFGSILPISEAIEDTHVNSGKPVKVLMEGQVYILRGDHVYNTEGKMVK